jgi:hypothetical protein
MFSSFAASDIFYAVIFSDCGMIKFTFVRRKRVSPLEKESGGFTPHPFL